MFKSKGKNVFFFGIISIIFIYLIAAYIFKWPPFKKKSSSNKTQYTFQDSCVVTHEGDQYKVCNHTHADSDWPFPNGYPDYKKDFEQFLVDNNLKADNPHTADPTYDWILDWAEKYCNEKDWCKGISCNSKQDDTQKYNYCFATQKDVAETCEIDYSNHSYCKDGNSKTGYFFKRL